MPANDAGSAGRGERSEAKDTLRTLLRRYKNALKLPTDILDEDGNSVPNEEREERLDDLSGAINRVVDNFPGLRDFVKERGFDDFDADVRQGENERPGDGSPDKPGEGRSRSDGDSGRKPGGGGGGGSAGKPKFGKHGPNWKLPGVRGKDFEIVRSPKGRQYAVYEVVINGKSIRTGVRLPSNEDELAKYGIKKGEGRLLSAAQIKKYKRAGFADELEFHGEDRHPFKALSRKLGRAYEGSGLEDHPEVMRTIIAQHIFGWSPAEFQNQLRNTPWYSNTSEWQRSWQLDKKEGDRRAVIQDVRQQMIDRLENHYGFNWMEHVKPEEVKKLAAKIASGEFGTSGNPETGIAAWERAQRRQAEKIEGTPAWMNREQQEEETRAYANRPEDMFEQLRSQAIDYLGYAGREKPVLDRDTLQSWAEDLVTERKSDGDWQQFLRQQMEALHPYFDPNISFTQQASAYKSTMESILNSPIGWDDPLLRTFAGTDDKGKRTGDPMALHDFATMVRKDERAWQEGTALWDEGHNIVAQLESTLLGVQ